MWWGFIKNNLLTAFIIVMGLCSCKSRVDGPARLYLASSLTPLADVITELVGEPVDLMFLSSSAIAKQIEHGAPCELAILADEQWRDYLHERNVVITQAELAITNHLVLASVDEHSAVSAEFFASLAPEEKIIMGDPSHVPLGAYAQEALTALGVYEKLLPEFVLASSARGATMMLTERAAKFAVLYGSDAAQSKLHVLYNFAVSSHRPIRYPLVRCKSAREHKVTHLLRALSSKQFKNAVVAKGFR